MDYVEIPEVKEKQEKAKELLCKEQLKEMDNKLTDEPIDPTQVLDEQEVVGEDEVLAEGEVPGEEEDAEDAEPEEMYVFAPFAHIWRVTKWR